jgi:hypothetical protein
MALDPEQADYVAAFYPKDSFTVYLPEGGELTAPLLKGRPVTTRKELLENPKKYVLQQDYKNIYELYELEKVISLYLQMDGAPLGDYDPSFEKFLSLVNNMEFTFERCGLGGHAEPYYLRHTVDVVEPKILIPLHSFRPEQFVSEKAGKIILPELGETITL